MKELICILAAAALFVGCASQTTDTTSQGSPDSDVGTVQSGTVTNGSGGQTNGTSGSRTNGTSSQQPSQTPSQTPTQTPRGN